MIGEYFLNKSLIFVCNIKTIKKDYPEFFNNLYYVLESYDKTTKRDDFTLEFKNKFDLLKFLTKKRCDESEFDFDEIIDGLYIGKYKEHISYLKELNSEEIIDDDIINFYEKIQKRKKMYEMIFSVNNLGTVIDDIKNENYEDEDEVLTKYERLLDNLHDNLINSKNEDLHKQISKLNLLEDDFSPVLNKLREVTNTKKSVKTGYNILSSKFVSGGFEPDRLYLIGGESGVGKSMLLVNLICNAIKLNIKSIDDDSKVDTLLYISAENYLHETFSRFYCCFTGACHKTLSQELQKNNDEEIKNRINNALIQNDCNVRFYYYEPDKTTVNDIEILIKEIINDPKCNLKCVYIDYLDKISSGDFKNTREKSDNNRFEQGMVAKKFKSLSNRYSIPIVTCTQLNRSGYNVDATPDLTQMGESMIKINESDAVIFLQNVSDPIYTTTDEFGTAQYKKIRITLLKNRNGGISDTKILVVKQKINEMDAFDFRIIELNDDGVIPKETNTSDEYVVDGELNKLISELENNNKKENNSLKEIYNNLSSDTESFNGVF